MDIGSLNYENGSACSGPLAASAACMSHCLCKLRIRSLETVPAVQAGPIPYLGDNLPAPLAAGSSSNVQRGTRGRLGSPPHCRPTVVTVQVNVGRQASRR